jgi:CelD/BcsL family acetyltransferase involved in cellulose biosynthesis
VKYRVPQDGRDEQALPVFLSSTSSWRETGTPSLFSSDFAIAGALAAAHTGGWLHFSTLECAGKPAAFHFGFQFGKTLSWYKPSFDWDFHRESPGTVLIRYLIEDASHRGLDELDFSSGVEGFKLRFANSQSINLNLRVFSRPWLHRLHRRGA